MSFYRNILKQAWRLTWRNKYLWWFGIFAALLGNGGELEILFNSSGANADQELFPVWQKIASTGIFSSETYINIGYLIKHDTINMIMVLFMALVVIGVLIFLVWLVVVSQTAIVHNSAALFNQKKNSLRNGLETGMLYFWPVLLLNILVKAAVYLILAVVSLPMFFLEGNLSAKLFFILAFIIIVPIAIVLSFIAKYSIAYVVINRYHIGRAIQQSWRLFKDNWLMSLEMAVILFIVNLLAGLAIILAVLALAVPFIFLGLVAYYLFSSLASWLIVILAVVCFLLIIIAGGAVLSVFQISSWTLLFLELNKKTGASKLARVVNSLVK